MLLAALSKSFWTSRAVPWQSEKQALLVEVLAAFADGLEEGSAADREVHVAAPHCTLDAHALSPEATTDPFAGWNLCNITVVTMVKGRWQLVH